MDWITLLIELVGVAILLMWIVIPIQEFRQILRIVKSKPVTSDPDDPQRGFAVEPKPSPRPEDGPPE